MIEEPPPGLAHPATRFIGREPELSALARLFTSARLVTIFGPPGVGKTRLAKEHAARLLASSQRETVWFCDLTEAESPEDICAVVGRALELTLSGDPVSLIGAALSRRRGLLLLDNFERLTAHASQTAGVWLTRAASLK